MDGRNEGLRPVTVVTVREALSGEGHEALWAGLAREIKSGLVILDGSRMEMRVQYLPWPDPEHLVVETRPEPDTEPDTEPPQPAGRCAEEKREILERLRRYRREHGLGCFAALAEASGGELTEQVIRNLYHGDEAFPILVWRQVGAGLEKLGVSKLDTKEAPADGE